MVIIRSLIAKVQLAALTREESAKWVNRVTVLAFVIAVIGMFVWLTATVFGAVGTSVENVTRDGGRAKITVESPIGDISCSAQPNQLNPQISNILLNDRRIEQIRERRLQPGETRDDYLRLLTAEVTKVYYETTVPDERRNPSELEKAKQIVESDMRSRLSDEN